MSSRPSINDYAGRNRLDRKQIGAFYTPDDLALVLTRWATSGNVGPILDPSFGGCSFLRSALIALRELSHPAAEHLVHGIDVDELGGRRSAALLQQDGVPAANFTYGDFLAVVPPPAAKRYAAVIGNPPYIRHHMLSAHAAATAAAAIATGSMVLSSRASTWAYFTVHATSFVRDGGRLCLVLPGTAIQADYSRSVWAEIKSRFGQVLLVRLHEQVFRDADEETVVLLAQGRGGSTDKLGYFEVAGVADLERALAMPKSVPASRNTDPVSLKLSQLPSDLVAVWQRVGSAEITRTLGDIARVRIGVVTGANDFFIRRRADPILRARDVETLPVITSGGWLSSSRWTDADQMSRDTARARARLLFLGADSLKDAQVANAISKAEEEGLHHRSHSRRRPTWWQLADRQIPDAFLRYMGAEAPGIVANDARATCTNSVHRLWWSELDGLEIAAAIVSSWSTLFAFASELHGRHYGGGILKLEVGAVLRLPVLTEIPDAVSVLEELDTLLKAGDRQAAVKLADQATLERVLKLNAAEIKALRHGHIHLARRRMRRINLTQSLD